MRPDLEITGTLVEADGNRDLTLAVAEGRVVAWLDRPSGRARETVDATGALLLPGAVDEHVHLMEPGDGSRETAEQGTAAAAVGGVTCLVEHTHHAPVTDAPGLAAKAAAMADRIAVDVLLGAHADPERPHLAREAHAAGAAFIKVFTCTTHGIAGIAGPALRDLLGVTAACGARVLAHCEDERTTAADEASLKAAGRTDWAALREWRSPGAELLAAAEVCLLARLTRASVTIAHAAQPETVDLVARERRAGAPVTVETCPQYLLLDGAEVDDLGARRKFTPPARARPAAEGLRRHLRNGTIDVVAADHAPSTAAQKDRGGVWDAPFGLPGVETTLPLLLSLALEGGLGLPDLVRVTSTTPARLLGLAGRKGTLRPGADADLVLVDPGGTRVLCDADVVSGAGWTPFAGRTLRGVLVETRLRGEVVARDGRPAGAGAAGRILPGPGAVPPDPSGPRPTVRKGRAPVGPTVGGTAGAAGPGGDGGGPGGPTG